MPLPPLSSEENVSLLIDTFYKKVVKDPVIGFIFTDVVSLSWEKHIPIMNRFWNSLLFGANSYSGNPMEKHIALAKKIPLTEEHFNRWLELWKTTVRELFEGPKADEAIARAANIAGIMFLKVGTKE
ncbi:MAG TPA: group III truncated hemoglobin [Bacteroidia bacterium]|nr:group III truncated hemoglobin [Bacteroidia bacterium]